MARIYKRTDRIEVKIDDLIVKLAPLTFDQKTEIQQAMIKGRADGNLKELSRGIALSIQYSVKGVNGLVDGDGNPYTLEFDGEILSKNSVDDLMNLEVTPKLTMVCASMVNGIPSEFRNNDNKPIDGVEVVKADKEASEKK
jgi:hypothetical protein